MQPCCFTGFYRTAKFHKVYCKYYSTARSKMAANWAACTAHLITLLCYQLPMLYANPSNIIELKDILQQSGLTCNKNWLDRK